MASSWLYALPVYLAGRFILQLIPLMFYVPAIYSINLAVAFISCFIFKSGSKKSFPINMGLIMILTALEILCDLDILPGLFSWCIFAAFIAFSILGSRWE